MWFDAHAKLAEITGGTPATSATTATPQAETPRRVAEVASVAAPQRQKPQTARADGLDPDAGALLDFLHLHGPSSYGAAATALGWGATRAWRAEAKLRAHGLVRMGELGRAEADDPHNSEQVIGTALRSDPPGDDPEMTPEELAHDLYEERAAIREHDGGQDRAEAERAAWQETRQRREL